MKSPSNRSGYTGVFWNKGKWEGRPAFGNVKSNVGVYDTAKEAAKAIALAAKQKGIPWEQPKEKEPKKKVVTNEEAPNVD